jgi:hypothetical protein
MRRAPGWARRIDGLSGNGEPPRCHRGSTTVSLSETAACYLDLRRALKLLGENGPGCPKRPADAKVLAVIVEAQLEGNGYGVIARRLREAKVRRLRGGQIWSVNGVRHALDRAYYWLCHPALGALLTWDEWRG